MVLPILVRMRWLLTMVLLGVVAVPVSTQSRKPVRRPPPRQKAAAEMSCPTLLGVGVTTKIVFCDVLTGGTPASGVVIKLPPHKGPVTLTFDLHNRHTYSEELIKTNRACRKYTVTIGVLTADNTLISRAVIQNEFRTAADLVDRVSGGAGAGGLKAVAPTGTEPIAVTIPEKEESVSILGEKLTVLRPDATDNFSAPGRPIALISNVKITYRPKPAAPVRRTRTR